MEEREFFRVNSNEYVPETNYWIVCPASIKHPKNHAVMFVTKNYPQYKYVFSEVSGCLVFWPQEWEIPEVVSKKHAVVPCENPHLEYCRFFSKNKITNLPQPEDGEYINGAFIAKKAKVGEGVTIFPNAYIGGDVVIGDNCYIGTGVKIVGKVRIGRNVVIRENTVIGSDGLSTDRDENGHPITMPQFGGVVIEDDVQIGANAAIMRGAIDDTIISQGCKIDNMVFVSHNALIGEESFVVGMSLLFGSASVGKQAQISGGCMVGNYVHIGDSSLLGMGSVATRSIPDGSIAYGTPAKPMRKRFEEKQ